MLAIGGLRGRYGADGSRAAACRVGKPWLSTNSSLPPARHEPRGCCVRYLLFGLAGTLAGNTGELAVWLWMYPGITLDQRLRGPVPQYPQPRLQTDPARGPAPLRRQRIERLNCSGWVDRAHGIAHIPIDDAMRRIAQRGHSRLARAEERRR